MPRCVAKWSRIWDNFIICFLIETEHFHITVFRKRCYYLAYTPGLSCTFQDQRMLNTPMTAWHSADVI